MNRKKLEDNLKKKQQLIEYAKNYPLSVSLLWVPHCHNFTGIAGERKRGCGRPMKRNVDEAASPKSSLNCLALWIRNFSVIIAAI